MATTIRFLGIAAYEITTAQGGKILIDPCLEDNPASPIKVEDLSKVDLILVTHLAFDHMGDTAEIAKKSGCKVICGAEVKQVLLKKEVPVGQIRTISWGVQLLIGGIRVRSIMSRHSSMGLDPEGNFISGCPMGFIVYADPETRIYHSGDTALYSDLKLVGELYRPNIGLISCCEMEKAYLERHGILDHYSSEMTGDEGALAALWLRVEYALCNHYLSPEGHEDIEKFESILRHTASNGQPLVKPFVLKPGDTFIYPQGVVQAEK